ncbi:hypothetical protein [Mesorhizobium sp. ES1-1]|uniref:DUF4376 domain-containing protein n=1 Tax=Mesorhizobium sp. ES1-1 TaxID=2876629 RepID=UPI001CCCA050|nr:hypothetical protein [Mesorhizobium sp. ES1-1]MBZ9675139.1 hypothetical protein [Mesorhizobium sp. ES1-1]
MSDIYDGIWLRRWFLDLTSGRPECDNPVDIGTISAEDRAAIEAKNADIQAAVGSVEAYEAEQSQEEPDSEILALAALRRGDATQEQLGLVAATWGYEVNVSVGPSGEAVNAERERRILAGSAFTVPGVGPVPLLGRQQDQSVYLALLIRAQAYRAAQVTAPVLTIRDAANANHVLTADQMIVLVTSAMNWFEAVMKVSWAMKDGVSPFEAGIPTDFTDDGYWPVP